MEKGEVREMINLNSLLSLFDKHSNTYTYDFEEEKHFLIFWQWCKPSKFLLMNPYFVHTNVWLCLCTIHTYTYLYFISIYLHILKHLLIKENNPHEKYHDGWDYLEKLLDNITYNMSKSINATYVRSSWKI